MNEKKEIIYEVTAEFENQAPLVQFLTLNELSHHIVCSLFPMALAEMKPIQNVTVIGRERDKHNG